MLLLNYFKSRGLVGEVKSSGLCKLFYLKDVLVFYFDHLKYFKCLHS